MTEINNTNLITQLDALIATLNLSTESENRLSLIYKAAINIGKTRSSIITELETRIEATPSLSTTEQLLLYSLVTSILTEDRSLSVANLTALNALTNISVGSVYFVDSEGLAYIRKTNGTWTKIDPSLQNVEIPNAWGWGANTYGRIGDNTTTNRSSPVSVVGGFTDWAQVSNGNVHSLGVRTNGTAWAWGRGTGGRLGDNTTSDKSSPISIVGGFTDWTQLSAGVHSLGVRANGTAWAWGYNSQGQLGDGTVVNKSSPVSLAGGFTGWVQLSPGGTHSLGLLSSGVALAWGRNVNGQLGSGNTTATSTPATVVGGFTDWVQLSAGNDHSLGLRANGTAWAWGSNVYGVLGDGTTTSQSSPVAVVGGFADWEQVSAGSLQNIGLRANGTAWAWGRNISGQIGDGTTVDKSSPVAVVGGFTDWVQVASGQNHNSGVRANGTAWTWGSNYVRQLGDGSLASASKSSPVSVVGGFTDWVQLGSTALSSTIIGIRGSNSRAG